MKPPADKPQPQDAPPKSVDADDLPEDNRDKGNSTEDWDAEQNDSGRRK